MAGNGEISEVKVSQEALDIAKKQATLGYRIKRNKACYMMLAPYFILFFLFTVIPVILSVCFSFTYYNMLEMPEFIGWKNYIKLFLEDDIFMKALKNTMILAVVTGPVSYFLCLLFAWIINEFKGWVRAFLTLIFYAPSICGNAYVVWTLILSGDRYGYLNGFLMDLGFLDNAIIWMKTEKYVLPFLIVVQLWLSLGTGFLSFIAGLQTVDKSLYEAAALDGVKNRWQELWYVTLPAMKPQLMFGAVMQITQAFAISDVSIQLAGNPSVNYAGRQKNYLKPYKKRRFFKPKEKKLNRSMAGNTLLFVIMAICGVAMIMPLVMVINNCLKPLDELYQFPPKIFVRNPTLENFSDLFTIMNDSWVPFSRYILNTIIITGGGMVGHVIIASLAAYPLAKHNFPGKGILFQMVVLSMMFHWTVTQTPQYMMISWLHINNSYWALILPACSFGMGLYLMKQFMEQLPDSLMESARLDGASEWCIFWKIVMPNVKPAWLTLAIFQFQQMWSNTGSTFLRDEALKPLQYFGRRYGESRCGGGSNFYYRGSADYFLLDLSEKYLGNHDFIRYEGLIGGNGDEKICKATKNHIPLPCGVCIGAGGGRERICLRASV